MTQFLTSSFAKNIKHATYFKTANQQHRQNPVKELSCTNSYALVCFLRTNICGSFLWYTVYINVGPYIAMNGPTVLCMDHQSRTRARTHTHTHSALPLSTGCCRLRHNTRQYIDATGSIASVTAICPQTTTRR